MASGPEHYLEAERLLALAAEELDDDEPRHYSALLSAQVHAQLALVAVTADSAYASPSGVRPPAWTRATMASYPGEAAQP
jgi:hypothetical protein